ADADDRLSKIGWETGLLPEQNYKSFCEKQQSIDNEIERLNCTREGTETLADLLRRPEVTYDSLAGRNRSLSREVTEQVEILLTYAGYITRQQVEIDKLASLENKRIPETFDYSLVPSLRNEARQKLSKIRPATLGQASRISGVSPADISILMVWLKRAAPTAA